MAKIIWTEPASADFDEIAEYIALDNPEAADKFVERVLEHVGHLARHPRIGPIISEGPDSRYRQLVERPCRIFYRIEEDVVFIVHVLRFERLLRASRLE